MTAPVNASPDGEKIAMTAPVAATAMEEGRFRVTFTMPSSCSLESLPRPLDERTVLEREPSREVAALRFSGWATDDAVERRVAQMEAWIETSGRTTVGAPILAQYDPPSTVPFMRRNEILVELVPLGAGR